MSDVVSYRFLSVVGVGGFGKVYRARMETLDGFHKEVAIKVLSDPDPPKSLLVRFHDEAKILGLLRDRAIVGVEPPIQIGGRWAVVMEYVDGASCGAITARQPIPPGVAIEIVGEVARSLHNAWQMQGPEGAPLHLLHRDIKPDNIQITPAGEVRLLDFGIAKADFARREFHTKASFGGTPGYIAPERMQGIELPALDVYSLGVVLQEIVTGVRPRYTPTAHLDGEMAALATELDVHPTLLADPAIAEVIRLAGRMRAELPEDRPTARQVEEACRGLRTKLPPPYFREWAEIHVPHRIELPNDAMVGEVLTTTVTTGIATPAPPLQTLPPVNEHARLALGALLGGSAAVMGASAVGALGLAALGLYLLVARPFTDPRATQDRPELPAVVVDPVAAPVV
ncbi:MAG: serine/threonine-protein kinase, partial [Myxococcota bacterium]